ncbi:hypothetical protein DF19_26200 [Streptomyces olindensis]|nr:hypothetical protein DF19_26200 [Streptomyces olindensis]
MAARASATRPGAGGAGVAEHDAVRAQTSGQHHREIGQDVGEAGGVVAGVHDDQDLGIARLPVPGRGQPDHHVPELADGDLGDVVRPAQADRVQESDPGGAARFQGGAEGVWPARYGLVSAAVPASVDVAEQPLVAGRRVRPQPVRHIHRETIRPSAALGTGKPASTRRSRAGSNQPRSSAAYRAPCPRRYSAASDNSTSVFTGPSAHSTASVSSKSASARLWRHS